jgi:hypothetical protein
MSSNIEVSEAIHGFAGSFNGRQFRHVDGYGVHVILG